MRPHAKQIQLWLDNPEAKVYFKFKNEKSWTLMDKPSWSTDAVYKIILPEYQEVWEAYLDGELQYVTNSEWHDWQLGVAPIFNDLPQNYRRKPKVQISKTAMKNPLEDIDYPLLKKQKLHLLKVMELIESEELEGILNMIDSVQDYAANKGYASEEDIYHSEE